jgi:hypothetical protein
MATIPVAGPDRHAGATAGRTGCRRSRRRRARTVAEVDAGEEVLGREPGQTGEAAGVVVGPFVGVGRDGVGPRDLLEALLGVGLSAAVRVVLEGEAAERVLDRLVVGVARATPSTS